MASTDLLDKLERVERSLNIYSNENKDLIEEINIDFLPLEKLKSIVTPRDGDSLLYLGYILDEEKLKSINDALGGKIKPDFKLYYYVLECTGIYNW